MKPRSIFLPVSLPCSSYMTRLHQLLLREAAEPACAGLSPTSAATSMNSFCRLATAYTGTLESLDSRSCGYAGDSTTFLLPFLPKGRACKRLFSLLIFGPYS